MIILATRSPSGSFSTLLLIIIISTIVALLLIIGGIFVYTKQNTFKKNKNKHTDYPDEYKKKNLIQSLFKCFDHRKRLGSNGVGHIPSDQSLTGLLEELSTSTMGPGK